MKILAFDSSTDILSMCLHDGQRVRAAYKSEVSLRHSETFMTILRGLLKKAGWGIRDVGVIAVGVGPGSFSGLRVGLMAAKVFSYVTKAKLVEISSLAASAHASGKSGDIAVTRDAKKGLVYAALYHSKGDRLDERIAPALFRYEEFIRKCPKAAVISDCAVPAESVAALALKKITDKQFIDAFQLEPDYLHARDCNVTTKK